MHPLTFLDGANIFCSAWHRSPDPGEGEWVLGPGEAGVPAPGEARDVEEAGLLVQGVPGAHHCRQSVVMVLKSAAAADD